MLLALVAAAAAAVAAPPARAQLAPPICPPAPRQIGFAPPLDVPLRLDISSERPLSDGKTLHFQSRYRLVFSAAGRGFGLRATLLRSGTDGRDAVAAPVAEMLAPLVGKQAEYLIGADGQTMVLQNGDALWQAVADDLVALSARSPVAEGRQVGAAISALPPAQREALLMADIRQMLRFAGRDWSDRFAARPDHDNRDCGLVSLVERTVDDGSRVLEQSQWQVDARTGLVRLHREERWLRRGDTTPPVLASRALRSLLPE